MTAKRFTYKSDIPSQCNIDAAEFHNALEYLTSRLKPDIIEVSLVSQHLSDLSRGRDFYTRSKILQLLEGVHSLNRVLKKIQDEKGSLWTPRGEWFQLELAACLKRSFDSLELEKEIEGKPRDIIVLTPCLLNFECKAFLQGKALTEIQEKQSKKLFKHGAWMVIHGYSLGKDGLREVTSMTNIGGKQLELRSSYPDEKKRIYDALLDKDAQAPSVMGTVLALDTFYLSPSSAIIKQVLQEMLTKENLRNIKGFLLFEQKPVPYTEPSGFLVSTFVPKSKVSREMSSVLKQIEGEYIFQ